MKDGEEECLPLSKRPLPKSSWEVVILFCWYCGRVTLWLDHCAAARRRLFPPSSRYALLCYSYEGVLLSLKSCSHAEGHGSLYLQRTHHADEQLLEVSSTGDA